MNVSNFAGRGFDVMRPPLAGFVVRELRRVSGDSWRRENVIPKVSNNTFRTSTTDPAIHGLIQSRLCGIRPPHFCVFPVPCFYAVKLHIFIYHPLQKHIKPFQSNYVNDA
jgi:hypothetical protein